MKALLKSLFSNNSQQTYNIRGYLSHLPYDAQGITDPVQLKQYIAFEKKFCYTPSFIESRKKQ